MSRLTGNSKVKSALQILIGGHIFGAGLATWAGTEGWYRDYLMPMARLLDAETSHWLAVKAAKYRFVPCNKHLESAVLETEVFGRKFSNPVGLAAGFDKHGEAVDGLLKMGFGFVEVGTVTPKPQPGNPKPRMFRLTQDKAVINRYGFNSEGHDVVLERMQARLKEKLGPVVPDDRNMLNEQLWSPDRPTTQGRKHPVPGVVGVNLGKNKESESAEADYVSGVEKFAGVADYLVINVSSPNTPGLRGLQGRTQLQNLVNKVSDARKKQPEDRRPPILVKIAPDLTEQDKADIAAVVARPGSPVDGLIVCNTTISRPETLQSSNKKETGGLSGEPLKNMATNTVRDMYRLTQGRIPIVGVGGISSGQDAYDKIRAGASLVQVYTALGYLGPPLVEKVKRELLELLNNDGYKNVGDAVGADFKAS